MVSAALNQLLTRQEVEARLHVSESTVRRLVRGGDLVAHRVGAQLRFSAEDVEAYLAGARGGAI